MSFFPFIGFQVLFWALLLAKPAHGTDEPTAILECLESTNKVFFAPSSARDDWFVDCIVEMSDSADPRRLYHRLATGDGDDLLGRLETGVDPSPSPGRDCPYLRLHVTSPLNSDEVFEKPMRTILLTALNEVGFVVVGQDEPSKWEGMSTVLKLGSGAAVWSFEIEPVPELEDGLILWTRNFIRLRGKKAEFRGVINLRAFQLLETKQTAAAIADFSATSLLPGAHRRCENLDTSLRATELRLERIREGLVKEIERVRRLRSEQEKHLEIKIEQ